MYEIVQALLDFKPSFAPGFTALSAAENTKAAQAPQNTARSAECLALCPLPCCCSLFHQVACQATAIPVPRLRTHWVKYISMNGSALQFLLKGRAYLLLGTAGSCKGAVCRLSVVGISGFVFFVFFLCFRFVSNYAIADCREICAGGPCYNFWDHDVVDTMSIVNSIERTQLRGVVYRDIRAMKDHKEFGVGKVFVTDARVSVFFSNISGVYCWSPHETFWEGSAIPWASDPHTNVTAPPLEQNAVG